VIKLHRKLCNDSMSSVFLGARRGLGGGSMSLSCLTGFLGFFLCFCFWLLVLGVSLGVLLAVAAAPAVLFILFFLGSFGWCLRARLLSWGPILGAFFGVSFDVPFGVSYTVPFLYLSYIYIYIFVIKKKMLETELFKLK